MLILKQGVDYIKIKTDSKARAENLATILIPYLFDSDVSIAYEEEKESPDAEIEEEVATEENIKHDNSTTNESEPSSEDESKGEEIAIEEVIKPEKDLTIMAMMFEDGMSKKKVAEHFGVSVSTIYNWIGELEELNDLYDKAGVS